MSRPHFQTFFLCLVFDVGCDDFLYEHFCQRPALNQPLDWVASLFRPISAVKSGGDDKKAEGKGKGKKRKEFLLVCIPYAATALFFTAFVTALFTSTFFFVASLFPISFCVIRTAGCFLVFVSFFFFFFSSFSFCFFSVSTQCFHCYLLSSANTTSPAARRQ